MDILFILKKTIGFALQPYGFILICFVLFIVLRLFGKKILATFSFVLGVLLYILFANPFIANVLSNNLENQYPKYTGQNANYIISLGNEHYENENIPISSSLSGTGTKRVLEALSIYNSLKTATYSPKMIFTGYAGFGKKHTYATTAAYFATHFKVASKDMIISGAEKDTDDEAKFVKSIVKDDAIILVTSAMHMPRSVALFKKYGINIIPAPTDFKTDTKGFWSLPRIHYLQQSSLAIHEYLGIALEELKTHI